MASTAMPKADDSATALIKLHRERSSGLRSHKEGFLRRKGWRDTNETPHGGLLWMRTMSDGRTYLVSMGTAIAIQRAIECSDIE